MQPHRFYRRRLPHWRVQGATYFTTWRLHASQHELTAADRTIVSRTIKHFNGDRYELIAFVVMNDHVHVLCTPTASYRLEDLLHTWKSFTANVLGRVAGRTGHVWQDESFDRIVRDDEELLEKTKYILDNPRKRWPETEAYPWVDLCH